MPEYSHLTDEEVLNIADDYDDLTIEAKQNLAAELRRRNLSLADVTAYHEETIALADRPDPNLFTAHVSLPYGIGKKFLGKLDYSLDTQSQFEEFETTLWFVMFWFPLIPISGCRIKRDVGRDWRHGFTRRIWIVSKLPRNWNLILVTWIKGCLILLALDLLVRFLPPLLAKLPKL